MTGKAYINTLTEEGTPNETSPYAGLVKRLKAPIWTTGTDIMGMPQSYSGPDPLRTEASEAITTLTSRAETAEARVKMLEGLASDAECALTTRYRDDGTLKDWPEYAEARRVKTALSASSQTLKESS